MSSETTPNSQANHVAVPSTVNEFGRNDSSEIHSVDLDQVSHEVDLKQLSSSIQAATRRRLALGSNDVYEQVLQLVEAAMIEAVMQDSNQNLTRAAQRLGLSRPTLRSKIRARMSFE